ncbi:rad50-interacting protein [Anaeramoeba ignava]|uniref:Rad50-interacting protein n=1 Tax=Anaeramoeba ignava TaxID=1746090 RepID=A0A9Q0RC46_ANAIG|nr:rad50-interacting protein [Anaeramoeba ignava]
MNFIEIINKYFPDLKSFQNSNQILNILESQNQQILSKSNSIDLNLPQKNKQNLSNQIENLKQEIIEIKKSLETQKEKQNTQELKNKIQPLFDSLLSSLFFDDQQLNLIEKQFEFKIDHEIPNKINSNSSFLQKIREATDSKTKNIDSLFDLIPKDAEDFHHLLNSKEYQQIKSIQVNNPEKLEIIENKISKITQEIIENKKQILTSLLDAFQWPAIRIDSVDKLDGWKIFSQIFGDLLQLKWEAAFELITRPLMIRFKFNFYGDVPTNDIAHPEWIFKYIFDLKKNHLTFLDKFIQPIFIQRKITHVYVHTLLIEQLIHEATKKIIQNLNQITKQYQPKNMSKDEKDLFYHTINELFNFQQNLSQEYEFSDSFPDPISIFTDSPIHYQKGVTMKPENSLHFYYFKVWKFIEKELLHREVIKLFESKNCLNLIFNQFTPQKSLMVDLKPTYFSYGFTILLLDFFNRVKHLQSSRQCLSLSNKIAIYLLDLFCDLLKKKYSSNSNIVIEIICPLINSANYVKQVLEDLNHDFFFIQLENSKNFYLNDPKQKTQKLWMNEIIQSPSLSQTKPIFFQKKIQNLQNLIDYLLEEFIRLFLQSFNKETIPLMDQESIEFVSIKHFILIYPNLFSKVKFFYQKLRQVEQILIHDQFEKLFLSVSNGIQKNLFNSIVDQNFSKFFDENEI